MRRQTGLLVAALTLAAACSPKRVDYNLPRGLLTPLRHTNLTDGTRRYAELFCGLLATHLSDSQWAACGNYLDLPGVVQPASIGSLITRYRVLVVPGAFSDCAEAAAPAFGPAIDHLKNDHHIDAEGFKYPDFFDTTESGRRLAEYIDRKWQVNQDPFILIGYSKGAADALEAFVQLSNASTKIAALVSVAGAVDGSRIPEQFNTLWGGPLRPVNQALNRVRRCLSTNDVVALKSLGRKTRMDFLSRHDFSGLHRYSIVASVERENVSRVLLPLWDRVAPYSLDQDSQVIVEEGILPRASFLGVAKADHWAVAMPFSDMNNQIIDTLVHKNKFPRTVLLEAALRLVLQDLPPR